VLLFACGNDSDEGPASQPGENLQKGWTEYRLGNYSTAMLEFEESLTEDGSHMSDAYNGLGWVYLGFSQSAYVNEKNISTALSKFQQAITFDANNSDAWVGQAASLMVRRSSQDDLRNALKAIDSAVKGNPEYLYRHDYNSEADLHTLKAQCYYYLGELEKSRDAVNRALDVEKNNPVALAIRKLLY
jgi:tetratricopeptide (TPR) repeat protein